MVSVLRPWCLEIVALASDSRQIMRGGRHTRENRKEKNERGQERGRKVMCRWSGRVGEREQACRRPTSEQESERGIGSRSSLAHAAAFPSLPWEVAAYPPAADPCSLVKRCNATAAAVLHASPIAHRARRWAPPLCGHAGAPHMQGPVAWLCAACEGRHDLGRPLHLGYFWWLSVGAVERIRLRRSRGSTVSTHWRGGHPVAKGTIMD
jgi:hypothetical protein